MLNYHYIIADHIRASCFIIAAGVLPSGKQKGYVLRKLIRRSLSASLKLQIDITNPLYLNELVDKTLEIYDTFYPELEENKNLIIDVLQSECVKYNNAIRVGEKEWSKVLNKRM